MRDLFRISQKFGTKTQQARNKPTILQINTNYYYTDTFSED